MREQVLRGLGWNILRVWSTDWWYDAKGAIERLHEALTTLLEKSRQVPQVIEEVLSPTSEIDLEEVAGVRSGDEAMSKFPGFAEPDVQADDIVEIAVGSAAIITQVVPSHPVPVMMPDGPAYRLADLSAYAADPENFFEFSYRPTIRAMVDVIVETEAPLREDVLAQRIARAHGWLRTGARIRERIALHLKDVDRTEESSGAFIWKKGTVSDFLPYRSATGGEARRAIFDIPLAELAFVVRSQMDLLDELDPSLALARFLGIERLAATSRSRLEEAIGRVREGVGAK